jgi:hypothetical protein
MRMPDYYLAAEHRAECLGLTGDLAGSRDAYLRVIEQTGGAVDGNPEFMAALSGVYAELGNKQESAQWQQRAQAGFKVRMALYPDAYAAHAIDFFVESGDLAQAKQLAENNLKIRQDVGSYVSMANVALAMGDKPALCAALSNAVASKWRPPELAELQSTTEAKACL